MSGKFRVATIALDEDQEVSAVTVVTGIATLGLMKDTLDDLSWTVLSEFDSEAVLDVQDVMKLFRACGSMRGTDPRYPQAHEIYDSLSGIVYGLIETE